MKNKYLAHHGILGQRWGIRRFQNKDGSYTSAGKDRYGVKGSREKADSEDVTKKKGMTDKQKALAKKIAIGAAVVAGTALAAYGTYKLYDSNIIQDAAVIGRQKIQRMLNLNKGEGEFLIDNLQQVSKDTGFKLRKDPISIEESSKIVNPGYSTGEAKYRHNCFSCAIADVMNRLNNGKGLMVQAREATEDEIKNGGRSFNDVAKVWKDSGIDDCVIARSYLNDIFSAKEGLKTKVKEYCNAENGSIGIIRLKTPNGKLGHYIKFEINGDNVYISDSQSASESKLEKYLSAMITGKISRGFEIMRCDGLDIVSEEAIKMVNNL